MKKALIALVCFMLIVVLAFCGCGTPMEGSKVQSFAFSIGGFGLRDNYYIDKSDLVLHREINFPRGDPAPAEQEQWDEAKWNAFVSDTFRCNVLKWGQDYTDPKVYDGTQWGVLITGEFGKVASGGSNAYPEQWNAFLDVMRKYLDPGIY